MTREEIIEHLDSIVGTYEILLGHGVNSDILDVDDIEAIKEAISALSAEGEYIKKEDIVKYIDNMPSELTEDGRRMVRQIRLKEFVAELSTYSFPDREKGTDGTLVYNADGHFYGVMGGDAIMERIRGKADETNN